MSKSLYLKINQPKEIPIIRQQSMPKFFIDTPNEDNQSGAMFGTSNTLSSPVPRKSAFVYDLHSVVQMERERVQNLSNTPVHKESPPFGRFNQIKEKIKLRRVKSSLGNITNIHHSNHI